MEQIDTRGKLCPIPLIMTKKAIKNRPEGGQFTVITDNDTARLNLLSFLAEMGLEATCVATGSEFQICFATDGNKIVMPVVGDFCTARQTGTYIVVLKSETMGQGSDELGLLLMRSCINSLIELDTLPHAILLYNGAVQLAITEKDTAHTFEKMGLLGVKIIVCGACVDYFGIKDKLTSVAQISNMYSLNKMLVAASHVLYP